MTDSEYSNHEKDGSVTAADIQAAADRLTSNDIIQQTPVDASRSLSERVGGDVYLKMEHLQRTGSFKPRGAYNKIALIAEDDSITRVVAASAGNHAQGVALAANSVDIPATIVMPRNAPQTKIDATRSYGADVILKGINFQEAMDHAKAIAEQDGATLIHAYDDPDIIAGNGTIGLEILDAIPDVETVIVPIGGGGLIGGIGVLLSELAPDVRLIGVQAESVATVPDSLDQGEPVRTEIGRTIADGIATGGISPFTFSLIDAHVDEVVTVTDEELAHGILVLLERAKQMVEGAGAAGVAALLADAVDISNETTVTLLSGGNLDMTMLDTLLSYEMTARSQHIRLEVRIQDEPGVLEELAGAIAKEGGNIRTVEHVQADNRLRVGEAFLVFVVETSGVEHAESIRKTIFDAGYDVQRVN